MKNNKGLFNEMDDLIGAVFNTKSDFKNVFNEMSNIYYNFDTFKTKRIDDKMMIYCYLPMINKDDINIEISDVNEMSITAKINEDNPFYKVSEDNKEVKYKYMIGNKSDMDNITTQFKDGVLMISIPDKDTIKKTIEIM